MHQQPKPRILIVDDDPSVSTVMREVLKALGYSSSTCNNANEALLQFQDGDYDVVLTDYRMPEMTGIELCRQVRKSNASVPVILMSGYNPTMEENEMHLSPINLILEKPIEMACLDRAIKSSILSSRSNEY
jgi:CheY-like chemotaxis protein